MNTESGLPTLGATRGACGVGALIDLVNLNLGYHLFRAIEGDYFAILGLPLLQLLAFLRSERLLAV